MALPREMIIKKTLQVILELIEAPRNEIIKETPGQGWKRTKLSSRVVFGFAVNGKNIFFRRKGICYREKSMWYQVTCNEFLRTPAILTHLHHQSFNIIHCGKYLSRAQHSWPSPPLITIQILSRQERPNIYILRINFPFRWFSLVCGCGQLLL